MADPSMQTFCCRPVPNVSQSEYFLLDFNSQSYNSVCLASSIIGMAGAVYQIIPRHHVTAPYRWAETNTSRGRHIIVWLAVADLLASLGVFLRSTMWLYYDDMNFKVSEDIITVTCAISAAWIQYFYSVTWLWTLVYAIDMRFVLNNRPGHPLRYHMVVWSVPAILTSTGLAVLYAPNANYIPMAAVMLINPILYLTLSSQVEVLVSSSSGQITSKERKFVDLVRMKFCLINVVFYVCWLPNIINGILIWTLWRQLPESTIIWLWYIMALTNPLQALFNSLVYRKWSGGERIDLKWCCSRSNSTKYLKVKEELSTPVSLNESTPLIGSSINASSASDDEGGIA